MRGPLLSALIAASFMSIALGDEKEPPTLSLDSSEGFSFDFEPSTESDSLLYSSEELEKKDVAWLGLWFQETDLLEQALEAKGVRIFAVAPLGPAYQAGLSKGDLVTHWNGEAIKDAEVLQLRIHALKIGEEIELTIHRKGEEKTKKLKLKAEERAKYPGWEEWQPYFPTFEAADEVRQLFQEHDKELKAMRAKFEEASRKDIKKQDPVPPTSSAAGE